MQQTNLFDGYGSLDSQRTHEIQHSDTVVVMYRLPNFRLCVLAA